MLKESSKQLRKRLLFHLRRLLRKKKKKQTLKKAVPGLKRRKNMMMQSRKNLIKSQKSVRQKPVTMKANKMIQSLLWTLF